jgi:hypothetical protein
VGHLSSGTAERLFDLQLRGSNINRDLFEWRDNHPAPWGQEEPFEIQGAGDPSVFGLPASWPN